MKKIIFILGLATILSCSNEDSTDVKECGCDKIARSRIGTLNQKTGDFVFTNWVNGSVQSNYTTDCSQDGRNWVANTQTSSDRKKISEFGYIIKCK